MPKKIPAKMLNKTSQKKTCLIGAVLLMIAVPIAANAQSGTKQARKPAQDAAAGAPAASSGNEDKVDVTDMEKKYWSAKDSDFNVVQNRLYSKANRFALGATFGTMINDPWTAGTPVQFDLGYYFSERWGMKFVYLHNDSYDNSAVQRLRGQGGVPDHNQPKDFYGLQAQYVPFYAKMSVLNWSIIYFDMAIAVGAGMQSYSQSKEEGANMASTPGVTLDVSQDFYLSKTFAVRLDFKNIWYQDETVKYRVQANRSNGTSLSNTSFLLLGVSLYY